MASCLHLKITLQFNYVIVKLQLPNYMQYVQVLCFSDTLHDFFPIFRQRRKRWKLDTIISTYPNWVTLTENNLALTF